MTTFGFAGPLRMLFGLLPRTTASARAGLIISHRTTGSAGLPETNIEPVTVVAACSLDNMFSIDSNTSGTRMKKMWTNRSRERYGRPTNRRAESDETIFGSVTPEFPSSAACDPRNSDVSRLYLRAILALDKLPGIKPRTPFPHPIDSRSQATNESVGVPPQTVPVKHPPRLHC